MIKNKVTDLKLNDATIKEELLSRESLANKLSQLQRVNSTLEEHIKAMRETHKVLKENEEKYSHLFHHSNDGIILHDIAGRILDVNDAMANLLKTQRLEIIDKSIFSFFKESSVEKVDEQGDSIAVFEAIALAQDKSKIPVQISASVYSIGGTTYVQRVVRDMTMHKLAKKEAETLARYPQESPFPVLRLGHDGEVLYANKASARLLESWGIKEDLKGQYPPDDVLNFIQQTAWQNKPQEREFNCCKNRVYSLVVIPIPDETYVYIYGQDITEQQRAKAAILETSRLKSEFLATMSHEIRTPMNGIIGVTGLLTDTELNLQQAKYVKLIHNSADSLLTIINDILDFSKIEANKMEIENISFDLAQVIEETRVMFQPIANEKKLELKFEFDSEINGKFMGDPSRIRQILVNLIGNAIKFTNKGGVTVRSYIVGEDSLQKVIHFEVQDSGIGIEKGVQEDIFEVFRQADSSTTRKYGGTGLGLAISKKLTSLMNGHIGLSSDIGKGSIFYFELPLGVAGMEKTSLNTKEQRANFKKQDGTQYKILLVEDNYINQVVAMETLAKLELNVDHAANGEEAVRKLKDNFYDLVLMDCQMPIMDGYEATKVIRQNEKSNGQHTPIVAMTANAMKGDSEKCRVVGMDDYLTKPIDLKELNKMLEKWLEGSELNLSEKPNYKNDELNSKRFVLASDKPSLDPNPLKQLRELEKNNQRKFVDELLQMFFETTPLKLNEISTAIKSKEFETLNREAHSLKSSCSNLGASRMASLCYELEKMGEEQSIDQASECFELLAKEYQVVNNHLATAS